jgi:lipopolysaccharide export system permease protein
VAVRALRVGGRLDRYVARLFALSYLAAFLLVVGLYVIIDLSVNLDDYLAERADGSTASLALIGRYYLLHLPFLYLEMSPFVTLVAGLFTGTRLLKSNEMVAALGAGISSRRMLAPVLCGAALLAGGMFVLREVATDGIGRERDALREYLQQQRDVLSYRNLFVRDEYGQRLRLREYFPTGRDGVSGPEGFGLLARFMRSDAMVAIDADRMHAPGFADGRWHWKLDGGALTFVDSGGRDRREIGSFFEVDVGPDDIERAYRGRERPLDLSRAEATSLLARNPDNLQYQTVRQYHLTFPLAGLILLLVGMPFVVGQQRGHGVERVAVGVLLCIGYFAVDFITRTLGITGQIGPIYAAWFPFVLFGSLGAVLYGTMRS